MRVSLKTALRPVHTCVDLFFAARIFSRKFLTSVGKTQVKSYFFCVQFPSRKVGFPARLDILAAKKIPASVTTPLSVQFEM